MRGKHGERTDWPICLPLAVFPTTSAYYTDAITLRVFAQIIYFWERIGITIVTGRAKAEMQQGNSMVPKLNPKDCQRAIDTEQENTRNLGDVANNITKQPWLKMT